MDRNQRDQPDEPTDEQWTVKWLGNFTSQMDEPLSQPDAQALRARVFGRLVEVAQPIIQMYHSDLFHDAIWLDRYFLPNPAETFIFYWGVDEAGTFIGTDGSVESHRRNFYRVMVRSANDRNEWRVWMFERSQSDD